MNSQLIRSLVDDVCAAARKYFQSFSLRFWHLLLLIGFTLIICLWIFHQQLFVHWSDAIGLAGLCGMLVFLLLGTIVNASLHGYHLYRDLWVKYALWSMFALSIGFIILAFSQII
jgi:hypothetical protein